MNLPPTLRKLARRGVTFSRALLKDGNLLSRPQPEAVLAPVSYRSSRRRRRRKRLLLKVPITISRSGAASCNKKREFWRETHTLLCPLIGRIIFLTREKTSFAILIGRIIFLTCENYRSLLWLARTNLRTKIYDRHSFLVSISQYVYNKWPYCVAFNSKEK